MSSEQHSKPKKHKDKDGKKQKDEDDKGRLAPDKKDMKKSKEPKKAHKDDGSDEQKEKDNKKDSAKPPANPDADRVKAKEISARLGTKHLRDFEKIRIIGRGGVGRVWLVQLKDTDQRYAMKVMGKADMIARKKVKRALTEREILSTADHPFIVTLYYSFQSKTKLVFVMQYCAGGEFYRVIQKQPHKCLTEDQTRFYAAEVLLALEYLHVMGFIYRDLKPENILMHESGHIMLTDFDLSKGASNPVTPKVVTKPYSRTPGVAAEPDLVTNSFVGTEEYLAPEVIKGTGHNATVDWWTFGILMYEMLYGTTPFRGNTRDVTFSNINNKSITFPDHPRGGVSKECKHLLKSLLHRDPKKRLGAVGGATDIKDHPFFKTIKWQLMRNETPLIIPELKSPTDLCYFPAIEEREDDWFDEDEIDTETLNDADPFKSFGTLDMTSRDEKDRENAVRDKQPKKAETPTGTQSQ